MSRLSGGAILMLARNASEGTEVEIESPTLQIISVKKVSNSKPAPGAQERYRLILSDGLHFMQAMASTPINPLITSEPPQLDKNVVFKLTEWTCSKVQERKIVVLMAVEILDGSVTEKIGSPLNVEHVPDLSAAIAALAAAPPPPPPPARRPATAAPARAPPAKKMKAPNSGAIYPIEGLSPYQNKWTIKARVTQKSELKSWSNAKGDGKLFSVNLLDETGEIKATGFTDSAEKLYPHIEEGKVYYISKARVSIAKKQFSNLSNEYEITFNGDSTMELCEDQDGAPQISYNFTPIAELGGIEKDSAIDVLGIVQDNGVLSEITTKATAKQLKKRELTVVDNSGYSVRVTLWGKQAENWQETDSGIFAFKGAKVGDFGGRTLSMGVQSSLSENPDITEAHELRGWFDAEGQSTVFNSYSQAVGTSTSGASNFKAEQFKTIAQVKEERLGESDETMDYFNIRASILFIKPDSLYYPACPNDKCNKKISKESEDSWRCEKCDSAVPGPEYRYIINLNVADSTDSFWCSGFNEVGQTIIGLPANSMEELKESNEDEYNSTLTKSVTKLFNISLRAKSDSYNDSLRVRYSIIGISNINWVSATETLLKEIALY